jgi:CheY-like chemotaxis protein
MLRQAGADVTVAENGLLGVEAAEAAAAEGHPFDVILMDMQMPIMDGYSATRQLREGGYEGQIIAITAHAMVGEFDKCVSAGCNGYLTKPINRQLLIHEVSSHVEAARGKIVTR